MYTREYIENVSKNYKCLIHLDRLQITFRLLPGSSFRDIRDPDSIPREQVYNNIMLLHDNSPGVGAFYHSFKVYHRGYLIGRLHTATKLKKNEVQFHFAKEVFYSFSPNYWYEVYLSIKSDLGIEYNNINYVEIAVDTNKNIMAQFGYLFINTIDNLLGSGSRYKLKYKTMVHVLNNGHSIVIKGSKNEVSIYDKTNFSEKFILDYFSNNGFLDNEVYRIESKLKSEYIRYLRSKKLLDINIETLLDPKQLATIFKISTMNKITFLDMITKEYDENRNPHFQHVNVTDDLQIEFANIGKMNSCLQVNHYKTDLVDENILRMNYYKYLETDNKKYFRIFKASGKVGGYSGSQLSDLITKFNRKYNGNRTPEILHRMDIALKQFTRNRKILLREGIYSIGYKWKKHVMGLFA